MFRAAHSRASCALGRVCGVTGRIRDVPRPVAAGHLSLSTRRMSESPAGHSTFVDGQSTRPSNTQPSASRTKEKEIHRQNARTPEEGDKRRLGIALSDGLTSTVHSEPTARCSHAQSETQKNLLFPLLAFWRFGGSKLRGVLCSKQRLL